MKGRKHTTSSAMATLSRVGVKVNQMEKTIHFSKEQSVGIKTHGVIDYLQGQHGFRVIREQ